MKPADNTPPGTAVSRLKGRFFRGWSSREEQKEPAQHPVPAVAPQRQLGFPSRISEFLLVFRLKARRRSTLSADILERAVRVVLVTCKHWFSSTDAHTPRPRKHE